MEKIIRALRTRSARLLLLAALTLVAFPLFYFHPFEFETSLFDLLGDKAQSIPAEIRNQSAAHIQVLVLSQKPETARSAAHRFLHSIHSNDFSSVQNAFSANSLSNLLAFYRTHRSGLLTPTDRDRLLAKDYSFFTQRSVRKLYTSPAPPLFPIDEDPFGLLENFVRAFQTATTGWQPEAGFLTAKTRENNICLFLPFTLRNEDAQDLRALSPILERLHEARQKALSPDCQILFAGVPVHTATVSAHCKRDISILSIFSLIVIFLLARWALRTPRDLPLFLFSITAASLAGFLALRIFFPTCHLLAFVLGTSILGLTVDYSFHWLFSDATRIQATRRNLLASFLTTVTSLLPLSFSGIPVLKQTALFIAVGLATALLCTLFFYPLSPISHPEPVIRRLPFRRTFFTFIGLLCLSLPHLTFHTSADSLYKPKADLLKAETLFRTLSGATNEYSGILLSSGKTLEAALDRESRCALAPNQPALSHLLPPLSRRSTDAQLIHKLYQAEAASFAKTTGLSQPPTPPASPRAWNPSSIPDTLLSSFLYPSKDSNFLLVPQASPPRTRLPEDVQFFAPRQALNVWLREITALTLKLLSVTAGILFLLLALLFRSRIFKIVLPSLLASGVLFAIITLTGNPVNLFHLLSTFMLIGMSLDYTIFLASDFPRAQRPVFCSLLTSLAGFGALAWIDFPLIRSIGQTLGIGLTVSCLCSWMIFQPRKKNTAEQAATPLGLWISWLVYRLVGLKGLQILTTWITAWIWVFSPTVRKRTQTWRRLHAFTRSMADKFAVLCNGSSQPVMEIDDTEEAQHFFRCLNEKRGIFLLSSHIGTIEILPALGTCPVTIHAYMNTETSSVFTRFCAKHRLRPEMDIVPATGFGMDTFFQAINWLEQGDALLMAGDRGNGRSVTKPFLDGSRSFPVGAFELARLCEHPVFFIACLEIAPSRYRLYLQSSPTAENRMDKYIKFVEKLVHRFPEQWFQWNQS